MKKTIVFLLFIMAALSAAAAELPAGLQRVMEYQTEIALSVTFLAAFLAGIISFTSPCGFVLLPTFFAVLFKERKRAMFMTSVFGLGFLLAFALIGFIAGFLSGLFDAFRQQMAVASGIVLVLFGILLFLNKSVAFIDFRVRHAPDRSPWGVFLLGLFFGFGWTPCIGAVLGGIFFLSLNMGSALMGALFASAFALGTVLPMLVVAHFSDRWDWQNAKWLAGKDLHFNLFGRKIYTHTYNILAGLMLLGIGIIMIWWRGTGFFMSEIPKVLPWTMNLLADLNQSMINSRFFTSGIADVLGVLLAITVLVFIVRAIRRARTK